MESTQEAVNAGPVRPFGRPGELDLFAVFILLRAHLRRTIVFACAGFLLMVAYTLLVKPEFAATATILIPQKTPSSASLAIQVATGSSLDLLGGGYEIYTDILHSRTVAEALIAQYHLVDHYHAKTLENAEKALATHTVMAVQKEGLLTVTVSDTDPALAAEIANSYFQQLDHLNQRLAITAAGQQRAYYGQQMVAEKNALADSEVALQQTQQRTGVISPDIQARAGLGAVEQIRAELRSRQVELGALEQGATAQNPEVVRLRTKIGSLTSQLQVMQSRGGMAEGSPISHIPAQSLDYIRAAREVKFHETLFEMLARQYETAKQEESKEVSMIEILDRAIPPDRKSWPPRTLYCLLGFIAGGALGVLYTLVLAFYRTAVANPGNRAAYRALYPNPTPQRSRL